MQDLFYSCFDKVLQTSTLYTKRKKKLAPVRLKRVLLELSKHEEELVKQIKNK